MKVRVIECAGEVRTEMAVVELDYLLRYIRHAGTGSDADRLAHELQTVGCSRINGERIWFEYELICGNPKQINPCDKI